MRIKKYKPPEMLMATGKVKIHASKILRMVDHCKPDLLATAVPATALDRICVVDTGKPNKLAPAMPTAAVTCAHTP